MIAADLANMPKHLHKDDAQICASVSQDEAADKMQVSKRINDSKRETN